MDRGEITDKGSINQRAVLANRGGLVDELYSPMPTARVIVIEE
jgi:feruloyl-CoA synthase